MRKADKLFQLTNLIRTRQPITAERIAEALEVSVRTIYRYIDDLSSKAYGELETGETILAFASHDMGEMNLGGKYIRANIEHDPLGTELAFVTEDVAAAFDKAVKAGAMPLKKLEQKPWGQVVAYVRAKEGSVVELCSPVGG